MKILAIDDNQDNLTTLTAVIRDALPGCTLATALNGPAGLQLARTEDPDVILLDIVMPRMDGFEVCRRLKADEILRSIPVVFLTALRTNSESRVQALETGGEGFLSKPLDEQELVAQVRAMTKVKAANRLQRLQKEELAALVDERTVALRESLERFDQLARQSRTIIWEVDAAGIYTYVSPLAEAVWGYPPEELVGQRHFYDLHPAEGREAFKADAFATFARNVPFRDFENPIQTRDGRILWVVTNGIPLLDDHGTLRGYRGSDTDTTDIKQAREAQRRTEIRYHALLEQAADAIVVFGLDGRFVQANSSACVMFGYSAEEFCGLSTSALVMPEEALRQAEAFRRIAAGERVLTECQFRRKDGSVFPGDLNTSLTEGGLVMGIVRDNTERKRAEAALRQKAEALRAINSELERFNRAMVGRELRMIELKQEIDALCRRLGEPPRYEPK